MTKVPDSPDTPQSSPPTISIVIPGWKSQFLRESIQSALNQTLLPIEIIVVDDKSPDGENIKRVVDSMQQERVPIRLLCHDVNLGCPGAKNTGIRASKGDYFVVLDDDDELHPEFLERTYARMRQDPSLDFVYPAREVIGDRAGLEGNLSFDPALVSDTARALKLHLPGPGLLTKRTVWEKVGGFSTDPIFKISMCDTEFWVHTIPFGFRDEFLPEPLYLWRRHPGTLSSPERLQKARYLLHSAIIRKYGEYFERYNLRNSYLSDGYFDSARAYYRQGQHFKALWLVINSLFYNPRHYQSRVLFLTLLHPGLLPFLRKFKARSTGSQEPETA